MKTIKNAQLQSIWPGLYQKLKTPPPGVNLGTFPSKLPPVDKIFFENQPPSDNPQAIAYVTTEDADANGKLDSIHIVVSNMEKALKEQGISNFQDSTSLPNILMAFAEVISHELGHISDYKHSGTTPFPGGESVAESAAQQASSQFKIEQVASATNIFEDRDKGSFKMFNELIDLANKLDEIGHFKYAEQIDSVLKRAQDSEIMPPQEDFDKALKAKETVENMKASRMYHPKGTGYGQVLTKNVPFKWGTYSGPLFGDVYFIAQDKTELGKTQNLGDPFTYDEISPGKFRVVSAPATNRSSIGKVFSKTKPATTPATPPQVDILQGRPTTVDTQGRATTGAYKIYVEFLDSAYNVGQEIGGLSDLLKKKSEQGYTKFYKIFEPETPPDERLKLAGDVILVATQPTLDKEKINKFITYINAANRSYADFQDERKRLDEIRSEGSSIPKIIQKTPFNRD